MYDLFSSGPSTAIEAVPSLMAFSGLSCGQASATLQDHSCPQNQYHLGDTYQASMRYISGKYLLCALRMPFLEGFTSVMLFPSSSSPSSISPGNRGCNSQFSLSLGHACSQEAPVTFRFYLSSLTSGGVHSTLSIECGGFQGQRGEQRVHGDGASSLLSQKPLTLL